MPKPITPLLTVDAIIMDINNDFEYEIVLIKRKNPPYGWALPGGFVDIGETTVQAVIREVKEETNLKVTRADLYGVFSEPNRDPRGHTVSIAYACKAEGEIKAKDDAIEIAKFKINELPKDIAFDHRHIIEGYFIDNCYNDE